MKILHTSDWHLGKYLNEISLLDDQKYIIAEIEKIIKNNNIDVVVIAGDIYHRSVPPKEAVELLDETLNKWINNLGVKVMAISGNHDSPERLNFGSRLYEDKGLLIQGGMEKEIRKIELIDEYGAINFFLLPYIELVKIKQIFDDTDVKSYQDAYIKIMDYNKDMIDYANRNIIVAHSFFSGINLEEILEFSDTERNVGGSDMISVDIFKDFDYVCLGHLHAPQKAGYNHIRYSGSPLKYSLSEIHQKKGLYIIDIKEKGNINIEKVQLIPLRNVRVIEDSFENILKNGQEDKKHLDYVFFELSDNIVYDGMNRLRAIYPNAIGLRFKRSYNLENIVTEKKGIENKSLEDLFYQFYLEITDENISDIEKKVIFDLAENIRSNELNVGEKLQ